MRRECLPLVASLCRSWLAGEDGASVDRMLGQFDSSTLEVARAERVGALVYEQAVRSPAGRMTADHFRPLLVSTLLKNEAALLAVDDACRSLFAAGIASIRLKGADLLVSLYGNAGLRPMDDVDLLVAPAEVERAVEVLLASGYRWPESSLPLAYYREHHFHAGLVGPTGIYLELHWQLLDRFRRGLLDAERLLGEVEPLYPSQPERGLRLRAELRLLHLLLHLDKHAPYQAVMRSRIGPTDAYLHPASDLHLIWLVDIALASSRPSLDWDRFRDLSRVNAVGRGVWAAMSLCESILRLELPVAPSEFSPRPRRGRAQVDRLVSWLLTRHHPFIRKRIERMAAFDHGSQMRFLRLIDLAYLPFSDAGTPPRGLVSELLRGARMALALRR